MCGIVGYVGPREVVPVIIEGLRRLEYRGYDSAGIAVGCAGQPLELRRAPGKLRNLEEVIREHPIFPDAKHGCGGTWGVGHTRWATHGRPTEENAHPHRDCTGRIVVVHNGIVENYLDLKRELQAEGHVFVTETDTEIIAHLIEEEIKSAADSGKTMLLEEGVRRSVARLTGAFAISVISADEPDKIVAARNGPPAVIGLGEGEYFVASDVPGILHHTRDLHFLGDGELAVITRDGVHLTDFEGDQLPLKIQRILWDPIQAEKGGYKHFMLKEIFEQPRAVRDTTLGRISLNTGTVFLSEMKISDEEFRDAPRIDIAACGTSWHAALAGKYMIERLARIPVEVDYASEFRYRDPIIDSRSIGMLITQSGETADTLAAQREMLAKGLKTIAICNVVGAMVAREAHGTIYTHAGPEIGVASTKAFSSQLTALFLFALYLAQTRNTITGDESIALVEALTRLPGKIEEVLRTADLACEKLARVYSTARDFLYLGRGIHYPIALEGALKLKEISYIHAEGYPAGEMKHGPNALIDGTLPVVVLATKDGANHGSRLRYEKTLSNIQEVTARSGKVIAIATEGDEQIGDLVDQVIYIPQAPELLLPLLDVVPLQLLAYHIAVRRGCDVDQPRNLAKSVTVE
ncbi:Glucosamine--fructose-6-phosphate aminotransferase [isomerizing] [Acidisarcina polymorpha]|uniref:Glutamine--fructose-6-phosphate aminotransferase [isomerizing] n=1 Tax=Acidisarcina polymorpha TaxID=2211140 RepID=A0A2Z5G013_9BACT|nr:glutamine--fructose-6-phosphate transaminase (isomerizing) [Acidisarcina polymorpha]AXC12513.1 Glucosamine--fructose-6-phosphate aminotransferase [isomerizing] [Acidisarcina polymorpha]